MTTAPLTIDRVASRGDEAIRSILARMEDAIADANDQFRRASITLDALRQSKSRTVRAERRMQAAYEHYEAAVAERCRFERELDAGQITITNRADWS